MGDPTLPLDNGAGLDSKDATADVEKDVPSLAKYIKSDACKNVYVMSNLARLNLPYPEAVFQISFFRSNPKPCPSPCILSTNRSDDSPVYVLAKELYPGKYRPTLAHSFIKLLADKDLLKICFTQNIDTLERRAGIPADKIVEAHGSFAGQRCIDCGMQYDNDKIKRDIQEGIVPQCEDCDGYVKPDIVFFRRVVLPDSFSRSVPQLRSADLLFILGTSLTVYPFASLANMVPSHCRRVLINLDEVGNLGEKENDFLLLGQCDDMVLKLAEELDWKEDLLNEWELTAASVERGGNRQNDNLGNEKAQINEVDEIVDKVAKSLTLSEDSDVQTTVQEELTSSAPQKGDDETTVDPPPSSMEGGNPASLESKETKDVT
ncbi:DHS-like NAD/FAD-binding domain-containing protein [Amylostereum chailletii]|nr:DHS-like NAD/FAD-binding domain-containing protein [Amylostereum chailletii]